MTHRLTGCPCPAGSLQQLQIPEPVEPQCSHPALAHRLDRVGDIPPRRPGSTVREDMGERPELLARFDLIDARMKQRRQTALRKRAEQQTAANELWRLIVTPDFEESEADIAPPRSATSRGTAAYICG